MTTAGSNGFGKLRSMLWPIHGHELKKFLPTSILMLFILFVYTLVRDLKDIFLQKYSVLWIGAGGSSASTALISAAKLYYVLPVAFLAVMFFTILINRFGVDKTFNIIIITFLCYYVLFGFVLYPNRAKLTMSQADLTNLLNKSPEFLRGFITCGVNWITTSFYVVSEIWGTMAISSLFWQFANRTTMRSEVKRFFGLYPLIANIGTIGAGVLLSLAARRVESQHADFGQEKYVYMFTLAIVGVGLVILVLYRYITTRILTDERYFKPDEIKVKKSKEKVGITEGIRMLFRDRYLMMIAVLVLGYGVSINLYEVVMKATMNQVFNAAEYAKMQANISIFTGIASIFLMLIGANVLRNFKWKIPALITPLIFLVVGGLFFSVELMNMKAQAMNVFMIAVWIGIICNALEKGVKYALFDPTKSMAYLPLDEDTKTKGQAAVEVIGGRAGKAGGSLVQQVAFASNPMPLAPGNIIAFSAIFMGIVVAWLFSVFGLSKKYEEKVAEEHISEIA